MYNINVYISKGWCAVERTQIYLDIEQKIELQKLSEAKGVPMAFLIREAISSYLAEAQAEPERALAETGGLWRIREDVSSGTEYVRALREAWERPETEAARGRGTEVNP